MAAQKTILAVAVGDPANSAVIKDDNSGTLAGKRPYIKGLIDRLHNYGQDIGDAHYYVIDYRECSEAALANNNTFTVKPTLPASYVLFCMSTTVAKSAATFTTNVNPNLPVVAIVSTHTGYPNNFCGVSARRHQIARNYYEKFLATVPSLNDSTKTVYVLSKQKYDPSDQSLKNIRNGPQPVPIVEVPVAAPYSPTEIQNAINGITGSGGLLILPVDSFFGAADAIIGWAHAKGLPDFWSVTDWVQHDLPSALGGYGVSQQRCGQLMADKVHSIWSTGNIPNPPFTEVTSAGNFDWAASDAAAASLTLQLGNDANLRHA
jgi:hypothetical protein